MTAPPTHRAEMGSNIIIPCTFRVDEPPVDLKFLAIIWHFQDKEVLNYTNTSLVSTQNPRLSLNKDTTEDGVASLIISNVTISDGGLYRCRVLYSPKHMYKEVRLDIQAPPQITITNKVIIKDKESVLSASITRFYPVDIDIKWLRDGKILAGVILLTPQRNVDGTYQVNNYMTIVPTEENRKQNFSIWVQHESLSSPLQEDFQLIYGAAPSIHITHQLFHLHREQELVCQAWGFYPESIVMNWFLNGSHVETANRKTVNSSAVESIYRILPTDQNWGMEISCEVEHQTLRSPLVEKLLILGNDGKVKHRAVVLSIAILSVIITFTLISLFLWRKFSSPKAPELLGPIEYSLCGAEEIQYSLNLQNFYPRDINIKWTYGERNEKVNTSSNKFIRTAGEKTFSVVSECRIPWHQYTMRVIWEHETLAEPQYREVRVTDLPWRPVMSQILTPDVYVGTEAEIQCNISGYFPDKLTVTWYKKKENGKEELVNNGGRYQIPDIQSQYQPDWTLTCTARLLFSPSLTEEHGTQFICRVKHPSLGEEIERRTGTLYVRARPKVSKFRMAGEWGLSLEAEGFFPRDIGFSWEVVQGNKRDVTSLPCEFSISENTDGTYKATSTCHCLKDQLNYLHTLRVSVQHEALGAPVCKDITQDFPWRPQVGEIVVPELIELEETQLTCNISNYFPDALTVTWFIKNKESEELTDVTQYIRYRHDTVSQYQPDQTLTCTTSLTFSPSLGMDLGAEFICRVKHPSLGEEIERRTGTLYVRGGPTSLSP
uniref:LOC495513 protein n=1 Tax=Xenopus laevis TaxID=8355 RepID=Q5U495_XENLA|nr:LOC495513 protein [Xenopus laevis]